MSLINITSPHTQGNNRTGNIMRLVILATLPGIAVMTYFFGAGVLINVLAASFFCVAFEALILKFRSRNLGFYLRDYTAVVTGVLIGISLPAYCPWWLLMSAAFIAMVLAKHIFGGMGFNPFNPAMVAYALLLISFPLQMTTWPTPNGVTGDGSALPGITEAVSAFFSQPIDAYSSPTVLDLMKQNKGETLDVLYANTPSFNQGFFAGAGWEWINIAFLLGGLFLLYKRVYTWHAPVAMLVSLTLFAAFFYDSGSSQSGGSPLFHLLSGATMFGAFFIITDPVTSTVSVRGRLIFGALVGVLVYCIRTLGTAYPDGVAFAVLIMNMAAPFIDYFTTPRTYGHKKPRSALDTEPREGGH